MRCFSLCCSTAVGLLITVTASAQERPADPAATSRAVTALADDYVRTYMRLFPVSAGRAGLVNASAASLDANDPRSRDAWRAAEDRWLRELSRVDGAALWGHPAWVTFGFLREALEASRQLRVCHLEWWPVNQMSGWQSRLPAVAEAQPVGTPNARQAALQRWSSLPQWLDNEIAAAREGLRRGYSTPRAAAVLVHRQLDGLLALPDTAWPFWSPAARDSTPAFRAAWRALLSDKIRPAVTRYRDFLLQEYIPRARDNLAVSALPNGAQCYEASFRANTSLQRSPAETYLLGQATVAAYKEEIRAIGRPTGVDDVLTLLSALDTVSQGRFASRDEKIAFARAAVVRARDAVPAWFGQVPTTEVRVEPFPEFLERGSFDRYEVAPQDGTRPATYRINLGNAPQETKARAEITAFHETYPGHHMQLAFAQSLSTHPITQLVGSGAFVEGWARYAEGLAEEMGLYTAPLAGVARRAWPAHGMVADVGLHILGWPADSVAAYVAEGRIVPKGQEREFLVMRFAVWPAQITAYDTGALEIRALRDEAQRALGAGFDIKAFHDRVLAFGSLTLPMLRESIHRWIQEQRR